MHESDIVGRLGGEEFAVILPEPMKFAARIAERLRAAFEKAGVSVAGYAISATVRIGAAMSCEPVTDISALIARADAALYRAKHDDRNRLCAAEEQPTPSQGGRPLAALGGRARLAVAGQGTRSTRQIVGLAAAGKKQRLVYHLRATMRGCRE